MLLQTHQFVIKRFNFVGGEPSFVKNQYVFFHIILKNNRELYLFCNKSILIKEQNFREKLRFYITKLYQNSACFKCFKNLFVFKRHSNTGAKSHTVNVKIQTCLYRNEMEY